MKEIGGYFGLEQLVKNEYHKDLIAINTSRNALLYLIRANKIRKIYIPYYLCDSISNMLARNKIDFEYYNIDDKFQPVIKKTLQFNEYLFIVNYFGQFANDKLFNFKQKHERIICDNTHAFFQKPIEGIDTIYSCRKFFGVPDGAYLSTDTVLEDELKLDVSKDRMVHILGRFEGIASDYYSSFQKNDETYKSVPLM